MKVKSTTVYNIILFLYIVIMVIDESNFKQDNFVNSLIFGSKIIVFILAIMYLLIQKRFLNFKDDILLILMIGVNIISMLQNGFEINLILLCLLIIISSKSSMNSIFRTFLVAFVVGCIVVFLASANGIISDEINVRYSTDFLSNFFFHSNRYERHSFGFEFSNQVPFALMTVYFVLIAWKQEMVKLYQHFIVQILNVYTFIYCGSRFVFIIIVATNILYYLTRIKFNGIKNAKLTKIELYITSSIFVIGTVISFIFVSVYQLIPKVLDVFLNFRLTYAFQAVQYYGIHLLGSGFDAGTFNGKMEIIVDNGYIMLFMQRGIIFGIIVIFFWTYIINLMTKNKNPYILIPILMFAIENFVDYQIMSFHFITFMCVVCHAKDELFEFRACKKLRNHVKMKKRCANNV